MRIYFPRFDPKGDVIAQRNAYAGGEFINSRVVCREERADLALVQLERLPADARVVPLSAAKAKPGQQVHSVGNPGASKALWIYSPGKVRQVYADKWTVPDDITDLSGREISETEMAKLRLGPTEFLTKAKVQPQEVEELVLSMVQRIRTKFADLAAASPTA